MPNKIRITKKAFHKIYHLTSDIWSHLQDH